MDGAIPGATSLRTTKLTDSREGDLSEEGGLEGNEVK